MKLLSLGAALAFSLLMTGLPTQAAEQELDPVKAEKLAIARAGDRPLELTPAEVERNLREMGIVDTQKTDVEISEFNFPIGFFHMGPTDFIVIRVHRDRRPQFAEIFYNGEYVNSYWVSTGLEKTPTPEMSRTVYEKNWNRTSRAYGGTMTGALMYYRGYGVHMTPYLSQLGKPASHGCVRMEDAGIYKIWELALGTPKSNVTVEVLAGEYEGIAPAGLAPYEGGELQPIETTSGRPRGGRVGALGI